MPTDDTYPRPEELEERLDDIMEGGAESPESGGTEVSTSPDDSSAEHESMAIADSDSQDPGTQTGGGQSGG